jgi:hypothetical protein
LVSLPLPPNRTGGSPASGSPVGGSPQRGLMRAPGKQREQSRYFDEHQHPLGPERWVNLGLPVCLASGRHLHWFTLSSFCVTRIHLPALLHSTPVTELHRYYERSDSCSLGSSGLPSMNSVSFSEQVSLIYARRLPDHSLSNHLTPRCRRFLTLPLSSTAFPCRSRLRLRVAGSSFAPGRIEFVILGTGRSPPAALHHASLRRSCIRLQAGERLPGEDLHLSDYARFQAHSSTRLKPGVSDYFHNFGSEGMCSSPAY